MVVNCLANLPTAQETSRFSNIVVDLPVYILGVHKSHKWDQTKSGVLVFTDFTDIKNTVIDDPAYPLSTIPKDYFEDSEHPLSRTKLYSISVKANDFDKLVTRIKPYIPSNINFDVGYKENSKIDMLGVFCRLKFKVSTMDGRIGGFFNHITLMNNENKQLIFEDKFPLFVNLVKRIMDQCSKTFYAQLKNKWDLDLLVKTSVKRVIANENEVMSQNMEPPTKKHLGGTNLLFQQYDPLESQRPASQQVASQYPTHSTNISQFPSQYPSQYPAQQHRNIPPIKQKPSLQRPATQQRATQLTQNPTTERPLTNSTQITSSYSSEEPSQLKILASFDECLINKVSIEELLELPMDESIIKKNKLFEIEGFVKGLIPYKPFIIKPFGRTLKVVQFKLILHNKQNLVLEFQNEQEICEFLGISEVEEIINNLSTIEDKFYRLIHNPNQCLRGIKVKCKVRQLGNFKIAYWTCSSTLDDMIEYL